MIRVCTSSTETSLISLSDYKLSAGITTTDDDAAIQAALDNATSLVEGFLGYPLKRQVYEEKVVGYGSLELSLSRVPVLAVESIYASTELVDPDTYEIGNAESGTIFREDGWPWTVGLEYEMVPHVAPRSEQKSFTVVYEAGYSVNGSTESGWLSTGESVPGDIKAALLHTTTFFYKSAGRDPSIESKKIGDLSITYAGGGGLTGGGGQPSGIPDVAKGYISHRRRF